VPRNGGRDPAILQTGRELGILLSPLSGELSAGQCAAALHFSRGHICRHLLVFLDSPRRCLNRSNGTSRSEGHHHETKTA